MEEALDRHYELFEAYCIRNVFSIPDAFTYTHDRDLLDCPEEDKATVDKELQAVMGQLQAVLASRYSWNRRRIS